MIASQTTVRRLPRDYSVWRLIGFGSASLGLPGTRRRGVCVPASRQTRFVELGQIIRSHITLATSLTPREDTGVSGVGDARELPRTHTSRRLGLLGQPSANNPTQTEA